MSASRYFLSLAVLAALSGCSESKKESAPAAQTSADHVVANPAENNVATFTAGDEIGIYGHTELSQGPVASPDRATEFVKSLALQGQASLDTDVQKAKDLAARTKVLIENSAKATVQNNLRMGNAVDYTTRTLFMDGFSQLANVSIRIGKELNDLGYQLEASLENDGRALYAEALQIQQDLAARAELLAAQTEQVTNQLDAAIIAKGNAFDARANVVYNDAKNFVVTESTKFVNIWSSIARQGQANTKAFLSDLADGFDNAVYAGVAKAKVGAKNFAALSNELAQSAREGVSAVSSAIGRATTRTIEVVGAPADAPTYPRARLGNLNSKARATPVAEVSKSPLEVVAAAAADLREKEFGLMLGSETYAEKSVHALAYMGLVQAQLVSPEAKSTDAGVANVAKRLVADEFMGRVRTLAVGGEDFRAIVDAFGPGLPGNGAMMALLKEAVAAGEAIAANRADRSDYPSYVDAILADEAAAKALVNAYDALDAKAKI